MQGAKLPTATARDATAAEVKRLLLAEQVRRILASMLGKITVTPGEKGELFAPYGFNPAALVKARELGF